MSGFPSLKEWETTRDGLHEATQVVGLIRKSLVPPQANALHLSLNISSVGPTTGTLHDTYTVTLDFINQQIHTSHLGEPLPIDNRGLQTLEARAENITQQTSENIHSLEEIEPGRYDLDIDPALAADYGRVLYCIYTSIARFRATLSGMMTPLVLWPHHFDVSFLYFIGKGSDEHHDPHMNFGFAPFSDTIDRPYLYFYAWPLPQGMMGKPLPEPARWFDDGWQGIVIDYDKLVEEDEPEQVIESTFGAIFNLFVSEMRGD